MKNSRNLHIRASGLVKSEFLPCLNTIKNIKILGMNTKNLHSKGKIAANRGNLEVFSGLWLHSGIFQ